jgi:hypothetical protein
VSGGGHCWFKRSTGEKRPVTIDNKNNNSNNNNMPKDQKGWCRGSNGCTCKEQLLISTAILQ